MKPLGACDWEIPVSLRSRGEYVEVKSKRGKNVMRGTLVEDVRSNNVNFHIKLNGASTSNMFRREEWFIILLEPEIEDGLYVGLGNIYHVANNSIRYSDASMSRVAQQVAFTRDAFARRIKEGLVRRVADSHGTWAP